MKVDWDAVRDYLIDSFCNIECPEGVADYHCPDHKCAVWEVLNHCTSEDLKVIAPTKGAEG